MAHVQYLWIGGAVPEFSAGNGLGIVKMSTMSRVVDIFIVINSTTVFTTLFPRKFYAT